MHYATHQPHAAGAMMMFRDASRHVAVSGLYPGVSPGFSAKGLAGLGDWFTDAVNTFTGSVTNVVDTLTGAKAAKESQAQAIALAQVQAQRAMAESQATTNMVIAGAGAVAVLGLAILVMKR